MKSKAAFFSSHPSITASKIGFAAGTLIGAIIPTTTGIFHENIALYFAQRYADGANLEAIAHNHEVAIHNAEVMRHWLEWPPMKGGLREYVKADYTPYDFLSSGSRDALILIIVTSIAAMIVFPVVGWVLGKNYDETQEPLIDQTASDETRPFSVN